MAPDERPPSKPQPNHREYLLVLWRMTPQERLLKAVELSELSKELLRYGLRQRFPALSEAERHRVFLERLERCHNSNY